MKKPSTKEKSKTKQQLIEENRDLRDRLAKLERQQNGVILSDKQLELDQHLFDKNIEIIKYLKESRLFSHLPENLITELVPLSQIETFKKGKTILNEGESNGKLFFLMRGTVSIYAGDEFILELQRKGDIFGEMSVIRNALCAATVVAKSPVTVFSIKAQAIGKYTDITADVLHNTLYRLFSMILTEKLALTTAHAKKYDTEHKALMKEITTRKEVENQLRIAKEELEIANRTKNEFVANVSHELRTPLNVIMGFSELLYPLLSTSQQREYLESVKTASRNLLTLINDILDLSRIESGKMQLIPFLIDPGKIFEEIEHIFRIKAMEKKLQFIIEVDESVPPLMSLDKTRLRQVLFNIVGNAIKFTEKGSVRMTARTESFEQQESQSDLVITVEDSGIGIPADQQERIFESFIQQDGQSTRKFGGAGLGLAICKKLTDMMNGEISVDSKVELGSTFTIKLKDVSVRMSAEPEIDESLDIKNISFNNAKVLVVDDIETNRTLLKKILIKSDVEVILATNGLEAIAMAHENIPDLIIMDVMMPIMDGAEATKRIRDIPETKDIPIIGLTAYVKEEDIIQLFEVGFSECLLKPIDVNKLYKNMFKYLEYTE